jgi:hypothetical protein
MVQPQTPTHRNRQHSTSRTRTQLVPSTPTGKPGHHTNPDMMQNTGLFKAAQEPAGPHRCDETAHKSCGSGQVTPDPPDHELTAHGFSMRKTMTLEPQQDDTYVPPATPHGCHQRSVSGSAHRLSSKIGGGPLQNMVIRTQINYFFT